ncbi:MAG TPA: signal peptidase II [Gammaproteobacteria bacterium]|nr:signal peptidase II [Gammaproteobacteria bacterium]
MMRRIGTRLALVAVVLATVGCDRVTKHVAASALAGKPARSFFADTVRLTYSENVGGFLSLGAGWPPAARTALLTVGTGMILAAAVLLAFRRTWSRWESLGLALFVAGGASNWLDRLLRGAVIDFLNVGLGPVRTGIFNVADVAIMTGIAILLLSAIGKSGDLGDA